MRNQRFISFVNLGIIAILTVFAAAIYLFGKERASSSAPKLQLLQPDIARDWTPFGGSWKAGNEFIENESEERGAKLMYGLTSWHNYFVEADVQLLGSSGDAGLIIRSSGEEEGVDSYHGYFAGIRDKDNVSILGRADFGWDQYASIPLPSAIEVGHWYHLTLVAFECSIAFSVTDGSGAVTRASAKDSRCISSGRIGLKSYASGARWKNIRIGPADRTMLQKISGNGAPVVIGAAPTPYEMGFTDKSLDRYMGPIKREAGKQHFNAKARSIASLSRLGPEIEMPITIHGVVTITNPALYIQDSTGSIAVEAKDASAPVKIGDEVEAQGSVILQNYTPVLRQADLRLLWPNVPLSPLAVSAFELANGGHNGSFVELTGSLISWSAGKNGTTWLTLSDDTQRFYAIAESSAIESQLHSLVPGSRLLIRGVTTYSPDFTLNIVPFALLLPSSTGLEVIALPSWWNPFHISLVIVSALLLILGLHILLVRIQRWRLRAVLRERERLALDMHDTLAQSFAGIGFQLQAVRDEATMPLRSRQHVEVAIAMVHSSHEEAKRSISALRPEYLGKSDLVEALRDYANRIIDERSISITSSAEGHAANIPLDMADAIFRIGEEAISNAVRHAKASALSISLAFEGEVVSLTIHDDGCGFSADLHHVGLGIRGMEKRARNIGASLQVTSSTGRGTSVKITATLNPHRTISQRLEAVLDFIAGA